MIDFLFYFYEYATLLIPSLIVYIVLACFAKKQHIDYSIKFIKLQLFVLYIYGIFYITGPGALYDIGKYEEIIRPSEINLILFGTDAILTYVLNILLFVPFGFLIPFTWSKARGFANIGLSSFIFSFLIEIMQLFNRRNSDINDLVMNTIGGLMGYAFYILLVKQKTKKIDGKSLTRYDHLIYISSMCIFHFFCHDWRALARYLGLY